MQALLVQVIAMSQETQVTSTEPNPKHVLFCRLHDT